MFPLLLSSSLLQLGTTEDWEAMVAENTVRIFAFKFSNILQIRTLTIQYKYKYSQFWQYLQYCRNWFKK